MSNVLENYRITSESDYGPVEAPMFGVCNSKGWPDAFLGRTLGSRKSRVPCATMVRAKVKLQRCEVGEREHYQSSWDYRMLGREAERPFRGVL